MIAGKLFAFEGRVCKRFYLCKEPVKELPVSVMEGFKI
jgi:hypothetical protein